MQIWQTNFNQGKQLLSRHNPEGALKLFSLALKGCPAVKRGDLHKIIFYTGITLRKLGMEECALKTWKTGLNLNKNGFSAKMLRRLSNEYGMAKQQTHEHNDYQAFVNIQKKKYILAKYTKAFSTPAEEDMVTDLIYEHWSNLRLMYSLNDLSADQKLKLFYETRIYFPYVQIPDQFVLK